MTNEAGVPAVISTQGETGIFEPPHNKMTAPESIVWHMILDHELSLLSAPETGVLGSVGFTALGGFIGFAPTTLGLWGRLPSTAANPVTAGDMLTAFFCIACFVLATVCLILYGLRVVRDKGLAQRIRDRPTFNMPNGTPSS